MICRLSLDFYKDKVLLLPPLSVCGELAHLVERIAGSDEVTGSSPVFSTNFIRSKALSIKAFCFLAPLTS